MNLEQIEEQWSRDSKVDISELALEGAKTSELHHKYYRIFIREKLQLVNLDNEYNDLYLLKLQYYEGTLDEQTLKQKGWQPFQLRVIRDRLDYHIQADSDIVAITLRIAMCKEKIDYLKDIIKVINQRNFQLSGILNAIKWSQGQG